MSPISVAEVRCSCQPATPDWASVPTANVTGTDEPPLAGYEIEPPVGAMASAVTVNDAPEEPPATS